MQDVVVLEDDLQHNQATIRSVENTNKLTWPRTIPMSTSFSTPKVKPASRSQVASKAVNKDTFNAVLARGDWRAHEVAARWQWQRDRVLALAARDHGQRWPVLQPRRQRNALVARPKLEERSAEHITFSKNAN